ncbi:MAG: formylglycine-generating enzyme family protein, partial [Treponema sp.]|nr:formylglycine-generating enzyme family protein [Treponema sp.]
VSWYDCLVYCNKRSMAESLTPCYTIKGSTNPNDWGTVPTTGNDDDWDAVTCNFEAKGYRLPTEAEWEYMARGGNTTNEGQTDFSGSDTVDDVAWYRDNSSSKTHEVKKKTPNAKGMYDMSGNVLEWCWDWYGPIESDTPSNGASSGSYRVGRGGSWVNYADYCSVTGRDGNNPGYGGYGLGFRLVRSAN